MSPFFHLIHIVIEVVLAVTLAIVAGYATAARVKLDTKDGETSTAASLLVASYVLGWITLAGAVLAFGSAILFTEEVQENKWWQLATNSALYVVAAMNVIIGIMMEVAASKIKNSPNYALNKSEYTYAVNGGVVGIVSGLVLGVGYGSVHLYDMYKKHHHQMGTHDHGNIVNMDSLNWKDASNHFLKSITNPDHGEGNIFSRLAKNLSPELDILEANPELLAI